MRDILIFLFLLGPLPVILIRPHVGVLVWAWVSYFNPHKLTFGSGFNFPFLDIIAPVTLFAWLFSKEPKAIPKHPLVWLIIGYLAYTSLTTYIAWDADLSFDKWLKFLKIILFTIITVILINNRNRLDSLIWVIVLSLGFFGIKGGLFTVMKGGVSIVWGPPGGFIGDNNQLALALVMAIPLFRYLQTQMTNKYMRWGMLVAILAVLISVFGSQSRGAFLALSAMLVVFIIFSNRKMMGFGLMGVALFAALVFMPQSWTERMETITEFEEDSSALGRIEMWKFGARVANDFPLGGGFDVFYDLDLRAKYLGTASAGRASHSIYFETLGEHGYPGLFFFFLIGATAFFVAQRIKSQARGSPENEWALEMASMCQISLIGYAVAGAFLNLGTFDLYWHIVAIIAITDLLLQKSMNERNASAKSAGIPQVKAA